MAFCQHVMPNSRSHLPAAEHEPYHFFSRSDPTCTISSLITLAQLKDPCNGFLDANQHYKVSVAITAYDDQVQPLLCLHARVLQESKHAVLQRPTKPTEHEARALSSSRGNASMGKARAEVCCSLINSHNLQGNFWAAQPRQSLDGDVLITLDDGSSFRAHSVYLQHASEVFANALACHSLPEQPSQASDGLPGSRSTRGAAKRPKLEPPAPATPELKKLPLPGTTRKQALLLLYCLYAWTRETSMNHLCPSELVELAKVAHLFGAEKVLQVADHALVKICTAELTEMAEASEDPDGADPLAAWLNVEDAPAQHHLARKLHLTQFRACVGHFMGKHARRINLGAVDASISAVLRGAREMVD